MGESPSLFPSCQTDCWQTARHISLHSIAATLVKCEVLTVRAINLQIKTILPETKRTLVLENSHALVFFHTTVIKSSRQ